MSSVLILNLVEQEEIHSLESLKICLETARESRSTKELSRKIKWLSVYKVIGGQASMAQNFLNLSLAEAFNCVVFQYGNHDMDLAFSLAMGLTEDEIKLFD